MLESIRSRANARYKFLRRLVADGKLRQELRQTVLDGIHLVREYSMRMGTPVLIMVSESGVHHEEIQSVLQRCPAVETLQFSDELFADMAHVKSPTGVMAVIHWPTEMTALDSMGQGGDSVLLDRIQDAGNVGAILRCAAAAGVKDVYVSAGCAQIWSPRVLRAGQGAHFALHLHECANPLQLLHTAHSRNIAVVAAVASGGEDLYTLDLSHDNLWIFGNEGAGIAAQLTALAQHRATITLSGYESLNVAAAAAVCLFEARRQKRLNWHHNT